MDMDMDIIKIRPLNNDDYEQYFELINIFRETYFTKEDFINNLIKINNNSNSTIYVIELNNKLIATGTILYEYKFIHNISKIAHIEDICVHNDYRSKNYGKILICYLIDEAHKEKCYKVTLYCKEELEKFYKSCNMEKNGIQMAIYF
jgi:glucosamine-phosphate N-acetyltransferase